MDTESLDELLGMVAFPETPEERDDAENAIRVLFRNAKDEVGRKYARQYQLQRDELQALAWDEAAAWVAEGHELAPGRIQLANPYRKETGHA
jgi:hypothetical protein